MTTAILREIKRMNKAGMNDSQIADELRLEHTKVNYWRRKLGLYPTGINRTQKRFSVYDGITTEFIVEGTVRECCARIGMAPSTFRSAKCLFQQGRYKKYEIYEVEVGEGDVDYHN